MYRNLGKAIRIRGGFAVIPTNYQQSIAKAFKRITPRRFKQPPRPLVKRIFFSKSKSDILNSIGVGTVTNAVHNLNLASSDDNKDPLTSKHFLLHPIRRNLHFLCVARTRKTVTGKVIFGAITIGSTFYDCTRCILPIKLKQDIAISAAFTALESLSNAKEYTNDAVKDEIYKKFVKSNFKKWLDKPVFPQNWLDRPLLP